MSLTVSDGFPYYISLLGDSDFLETLNSNDIFKLLKGIDEEKSKYRYAPGKWSIKQIVGHITDHERIMLYRALRFSRNDSTVLPGYDQDVLVEGSRFDEISFQELLEDFRNVRNSTLSFIKMLSGKQLKSKGTAWKFEMTVEDILKSTAGHQLHHLKVLKERYDV
jgi:uncharacterized damage-inducible protein DinB